MFYFSGLKQSKFLENQIRIKWLTFDLIAFVVVSCIYLRKVTVSVPLFFSSATISPFFFCSGVKASVDTEVKVFMRVMIYSLSPFPLHFVVLCFYWYTNFSTSAKHENISALYQLFSKFPACPLRFFLMHKLKMRIKASGWKRTYSDLQLRV